MAPWDDDPFDMTGRHRIACPEGRPGCLVLHYGPAPTLHGSECVYEARCGTHQERFDDGSIMVSVTMNFVCTTHGDVTLFVAAPLNRVVIRVRDHEEQHR